MADDFFNKKEENEPKEEEKEETKVKVGEKEYTQEELSKVVGLGEIGREAEEKFNVTLDKVWPNLQATINEKKVLEQEIENLKQAKVATKVDEGVQLSEEELKAQVRQDLKKFGAVLDEDVQKVVNLELEKREIREDVQTVIVDAEETYGIKTSEEAIVDHMIETGIRNPKKAFKDLYEEKIDAWKEQQLEKVKKPGMVTETTSSAGAKEPKNEPVTKDNFFSRIDEVLERAA